MSDATEPDRARTDAESDAGDTAARVRRGLDYALLGGLVLLGLVAAIQFYFAADRTINVWVTREYRPPFKMLFNLVVLLVVGIGLSRQVRRLTGNDEADSTEPSHDATTDGGADFRATTTTEPSAAAADAPAATQENTVDSREQADDTD